MSVQKAVLLIGSARPRGQSTSESLGRYLCDQLEALGVQTCIHQVTRVRRPIGIDHLTADLATANIFVLASPVYVDSLPYLVTLAFERIAELRSQGRDHPTCRMAAILNCGFPEAIHTHVAIDICRLFAGQAHFEWAGGLGLGGGEVIGGKRLQDVGWMARETMRALDLTATALAAKQPVPAQAVELMAAGLMQPRLYTTFATVGWYRRAWENGVVRQLRARPFRRAV